MPLTARRWRHKQENHEPYQIRQTMTESTGDTQNEQRRLEHIKEMGVYAAEDHRVTYLRVSASLAIAVLFITQLPFARLVALPRSFRILLVAGILALSAAAGFYFFYSNSAYVARTKFVTAIRNGDDADLVDWWNKEGPWGKKKRALHLGNLLFACGGALLVTVLAKLLAVF
jgi:hypothetical protein